MTPTVNPPAFTGAEAATQARRERAAFNAFVRANLSPETATVAERLADLLGTVALPALDTLVRDAWHEGHDAALGGRADA